MDNLMTHEPVMLAEMVNALAPRDGGVYLDATFGGGGYTRAILRAAECRVIAIDRDPDAMARARELAVGEPRLAVVQGCFSGMASMIVNAGYSRVDGIVLDVGVSSFQLDDASRGFSFRNDGPLDMRMAAEGESAADLVATRTPEELARIFRQFGDEPEAGRVARAIVSRRVERPFVTTRDLAGVIADAKRKVRPGRDPATQVFQALRMAVNDELGELETALAAAMEILAPGGRLVVVAFHSAEDRLVKRFIDAESGHGRSVSRHMPVADGPVPRLRWLQRKAAQPSAGEVQRNPRARSARLRAAERMAGDDAEPDWSAAA
ncbi:MAG: 16S rRNA (cytosine(1402)-N(4))-methyltransferase RsmH [Geminicoccaceae bacterium]|nr:16S rRNA (cytosine(1402)-N(4))-methyltransferase RsmH [Geminicoccaceae bacterium]